MDHAVVGRTEFLAARTAHLAREKELTRLRDELSAERRDLPWLEITEDYAFDGPAGRVRLIDLFGDRSQLVVYHFMFAPDWEEGCASCSFWADNFDGIDAHLDARDTTFVAVSRAPLATLDEYRDRMGWSFRWLSSAGSTFNFDMGVSFTPEDAASGEPNYNFETQAGWGEEAPGISVFHRTADGRIFLTYQTFSRGLDMMNAAYHYLDLTPKGRDEGDLPWTMAWLRRRDEYPG